MRISCFRHINVHILMVFLMLVAGCRQDVRELSKVAESFKQTQIIIPNSMLKIQKGESVSYCVPRDLPIMIQYVGPKECSACRISHLGEYRKLFEVAEKTGRFEYMIVMSPTKQERKEIKDILMNSWSKYPVFLDINGDFSSVNNIPEDNRLHHFLIDTTHHPVFFGNPLSSEKLMSLFKEFLNP